ncbi:hypothetical protein [Burkholderia dolosa]|uniref:hypothetical protein n=1 Tax=Burkholderia dolosa TaxID=152500 RepID=UPI0027D32241|nr:hypothetical protein [Burkholderia dolosa]
MSRGEEDVVYERRAFDNVAKALDFDRTLPDRVHVGPWSEFLFFQSDYVFSPDFLEIVRELLNVERAHVACLLNVDKTERLEFGGIAAIFLDEMTSTVAYDEKLRDGGPADGWLYRVDRYACASDVGEWCIYCEKSNDVAVIGLRDIGGIGRFETPLKRLWAKPIDELINGGGSRVFPFDQLVPAWRQGLVQNYGR